MNLLDGEPLHVGGERWGASLYELSPGEALPYHWHYGEEEVCVVAAGTPTLRTPVGDRLLHPWDVAWFVRGEPGAHQLRNDSPEPARFVVFSTTSDPEVVGYPETGGIGVFAPRNSRLK